MGYRNLLTHPADPILTQGGLPILESATVNAAAAGMPSLGDRRISPHTIRHTTAMHLLQSGESIEGIALWLGHESPTTTHQYTQANLAMKERTLAKLKDPATQAGASGPRIRCSTSSRSCDYGKVLKEPDDHVRTALRAFSCPTSHNWGLCITLQNSPRSWRRHPKCLFYCNYSAPCEG